MASYVKPEWWDEWVKNGTPFELKEDALEWVKKEFKMMMDEIDKLNSPIKE